MQPNNQWIHSQDVSDHQRHMQQRLHLILGHKNTPCMKLPEIAPPNILFSRNLRLFGDLKFGSIWSGVDAVSIWNVMNYKIMCCPKMIMSQKDGQQPRPGLQQHLRTSDRIKEQYQGHTQEGGFIVGDLVWLHN